jgi:hypothetical protein
MRLEQPRPSAQELDVTLFLDSLGVKLSVAQGGEDGIELLTLQSPAVSFLEAKDNKAALLCFRSNGAIYPMSLLFLRGDTEFTFCHSTLLLDSYSGNSNIAALLRQKTAEFFSGQPGKYLSGPWPQWATLALKGQQDCRIVWNMKPTLPVATDVFSKTVGPVPDLPLFPSVYSYNNPYVENLLEVGLPNLAGCKRALVLGTGAGLDAVCIALANNIPVDATDINPIAVANSIACARRVGKEGMVSAWVSDGFDRITQSYDTIFFEAPLAVDHQDERDPNRFDFGGKLLSEVLASLPSHLNPSGAMYLMSKPDITAYMPAEGLYSTVRRTFVPKTIVAIHEIRHA